ncbi:MAG: hypothetical protein HQK77_00565 [Desulfobacterales bacterium]|nr:hypothetical protein [Desulfobacterales bacterium]
MSSSDKILKLLFTFPLTWLAVGVIIAFEAGFYLWFAPSILMMSMTIILGVILLGLWPIFFVSSHSFQQRYQRLPYEQKMTSLQRRLNKCSPIFKNLVLSCIKLIEHMQIEFKESLFQGELDGIIENLSDLTEHHFQLCQRIEHFGTEIQKQSMRQVLTQQIASVEKTLSALKALSGNLTLIDINTEQYQEMGDNLRLINHGLHEVIQEMQHASD